MQKHAQAFAGVSQNAVEELHKFLEVDDLVFLDLNPGGGKLDRYRTTLRGWEIGEFILIEKPMNKASLKLRSGQHCAVRFMKDGQIWGFMTNVVDGNPKMDGRIICIKWPRVATRVRARNHERINICVPCLISLDDGSKLNGTLCDLSAGGSRIRTKIPLILNTELRLAFQLPDGASVEDLASVVRSGSASPGGDDFTYGCEFTNIEQSERYGIGLFVARTLAYARGEPVAHPVVLVLSDSPEDACTLRCALRSPVTCEVLSAAGIIDAGYRLRGLPPKALFIRTDHSELPGERICTIVKHTKGLESLPVILYGPGEKDLTDQAAAPADYRLSDLSKAIELKLPWG